MLFKLFRGRFPNLIDRVIAEHLTYLDRPALCDLANAVRELEREKIPGVLVEAGCALGGSAIVLAHAKAKQRPLLIYDSFGMMPEPSDMDGADVHARYSVIASGNAKGIGGGLYYGYRPSLVEEVHSRFSQFGVNTDRHHVSLIKGDFEITLKVTTPVALAHIDCDWYHSVLVCLERIVPHLAQGGRLIIDDYKHYSGCRRAVDEYFNGKTADHFTFLHRSRLHIIKD